MTLRKPRPRFGVQKGKFPIGQRVTIGQLGRLFMPPVGVVIPMGKLPKIIAHMDDLVHIRIVESNDKLFPVGYEDYWNEWQLYAT